MHQRVTLDTSDLRSRLRTTPIMHRQSSYQTRRRIGGEFQAVRQGSNPKLVSEFRTAAKPAWHAPVTGSASPRTTALRQQASAKPALAPARSQGKPAVVHKPQPTRVLARAYVRKPNIARRKHFRLKRLSQPQIVMVMAACVFLVGMGVSVMGFYTNRQASAQALSVNKQVDAAAATAKPDNGTTSSTPDTPSTTPVKSSAVHSYTVAPDLPRYITILSIGVHARVLQVGVTADGALGTPANVFDTAWYTGSTKPGQPGATLIDGHVSSWTTNGVFYNLKKLVPGNQIQLEKGNGETLTYTVSKVVAYDVNNVDMKALLIPADPAKSGLNLITCGGKYDRNTKEFTQRIAVFAVQQ